MRESYGDEKLAALILDIFDDHVYAESNTYFGDPASPSIVGRYEFVDVLIATLKEKGIINP